MLVVGNTKEFDKPLSTLGTVKNVDITIPAPPAAKEETKSSASNPAGKALAAKVADAMGGLPKLKSIKTMHVQMDEGDGSGQSMPIDVSMAFPDAMYVEVHTPQGLLTIVTSPSTAFMNMAGRGKPLLLPDQRDDTNAQLHHDLVYIAQHADDPAFTFYAEGTEKIGDVEAAIVDVGGAIPWVRWYVDPKTGHVLREKYKSLGQSGLVDGESDLSDWHTTDGLTMPYLHKNRQNGQDMGAAEFKKVDLNPALDPKLFDKPAEKPDQK